MKDIIRRVSLRPYYDGCGPVFFLTMWDTGRTICGGKYCIGYRLTMNGRKVIFEGEDFGCSPCHAIDSDAAVESLLSFLTLRPGDTDSDYFADYTPAQLDYCQQHAEALSCYVMDRFTPGNERG